MHILAHYNTQLIKVQPQHRVDSCFLFKKLWSRCAGQRKNMTTISILLFLGYFIQTGRSGNPKGLKDDHGMSLMMAILNIDQMIWYR